MHGLSRTDRAIALGLVALLLVLLGLTVAHRSDPARSVTPVGAAAASPSTPADSTPSPSGAGGTTSSSSSPPSTATSTTAPAGPVVSAVGDSLMLDIQPDLEADLPGIRVDGMVSRQFETGIGVVQAERAAGTLGHVLVVELGTNGTVTATEIDAMMQAASGVARVVFVNVDVPRSWAAPDNAVLAQGVARYPGVAVLADWYDLASGHPEWFAPDQVHLEPAGAEAMARLIADAA